MRKIIILILTTFPFVAYSQLINGDFENIETTTIPGTNDTYQKPVNWSFGYHNPYGAEITNDSYSGNNAIKLWSWYFMQSNEEFIYGNGPSDIGLPISDKPTKLKGYYKFTNPNIQPNGVPDSAYVKVLLTKYNQVSNKRDTVSFTEYNLGTQNTYSPFEIDLNYLNNQIPDSIQIYFRTSYFQGPSDNTSECNYLYLDNLSLEYSTMSISKQSQTEPFVYPNPTQNIVQIYSEKQIERVNIYSTTGKFIKSIIPNKTDKKASFNMSNLSSGVYFIEIIGIGDKISDKIKIVKK